MLKLEGRAAIVIPEGVLFQTNNAFTKVKQTLLENFNVHTIVSLPSGVFLPYSGVKTNILYFDRKGATNDIWYYDVTPPYNLTKNKPILYEHLEEFVHLFHNPKERNHTNAKLKDAVTLSAVEDQTNTKFNDDVTLSAVEAQCNNWTLNIADIKDYDLSAKNPHKVVEVVHQTPKDLLKVIKQNDAEINTLMKQIEQLIDG